MIDILQLRNERHGFIQMSLQKRNRRGRNYWKSHRQTCKSLFKNKSYDFLKGELYNLSVLSKTILILDWKLNCTEMRFRNVSVRWFTCNIFYRQPNLSKLKVKLRYGILSASQPEKWKYATFSMINMLI